MEEHVLQGPKDNWRSIQAPIGARLVSSLRSLQKQVVQTYPDMENHRSTADWILMRAATEATQLMVQPGEVVGIVSSNTPHFAPAVVAALCAGAICATLSWDTPVEELNKIMGNLSPRVILCSADMQPRITSLFPGQLTQVLGRGLKADRSEPQVVAVHDYASKPAFYLFTSGSTGLPKKVPLTHAGIDAFLNSCRRPELGLNKSDVMITPAPNFWYMGFILQLMSMDLGLSLVIPARFEPLPFLQTVKKSKATLMLLDASTYVKLCKESIMREDALANVRCMISAGNCMNERTERYIEDTLHKPLVQWYGSTEAQLTLSCPVAAPYASPAGSVGRVKPWTMAKVVDLKSGATVQAGVDGELFFKGPYTSPSFAKNDWCQTGDYGHYDDQGNFYIVDRVADLIMLRGNVVGPSDLECALILHPSVKDAVVVGVPDDAEGMQITAVVSLAEGQTATADELQRHVAATLKGKQIQLRGGVVFVHEVPKTPTGKPKRKQAKATFVQHARCKGSISIK